MADQVFISYSHDSPAHDARVLALADRLRLDGMESVIDQYEVSPAEGWPKWMDRQLAEATFVLLVCTETYLKRVMGTEKPGKGLGVRWESTLAYQALYDSGAETTRLIPVLLAGGDPQHIPMPLRGLTYYTPETEDGYEALYRRLTGQPAIPPPPLGQRKTLPPKRAVAAPLPPKEGESKPAPPPGPPSVPPPAPSPQPKPWRWLLPLLGLIVLGVALWLLPRPKPTVLATEPTATTVDPNKEAVWVSEGRPGRVFGDTVQITLLPLPISGCMWEPPEIGFLVAADGARNQRFENRTRGENVDYPGYQIRVREVEQGFLGMSCRVEFLVTRLFSTPVAIAAAQTPTAISMPVTSPVRAPTVSAVSQPSSEVKSMVITEPVRLEFVLVPAGSFLMGSDKDKDLGANDDELPQHMVHVAEFYIGKYEVTNAQYAAFVQATGRQVPSHWTNGAIPAGKEDHPVVNVTWNNAVAFTAWFSEQTGRAFRLPTEA